MIKWIKDYSPEQIAGVVKKEGLKCVYIERIYQLICKRIDIILARPYHGWERGANENLNGLISQYFPKGISFDNITKEQVQALEVKLNNRPRKRLGFKKPNQVYLQKLTK